MASEVAEVERALLALAPEQRAAVIHAGLLSLDGAVSALPQDEVDAAWRDEISDRLEAVLDGKVTLGTFEETRAKFAAKHPPTR